MRNIRLASSRALLAAATAGAAMSISLISGVAPASAHVHVDADGAAPGSTAVLTFRVPGESDNGSLTTQFSVALPDVASARTEVMPGWTARLDRNTAAGTVRSVTWTAAPNTGISAEQFALFHLTVSLPEQESVSFPATQTYSDGRVVRWDQPPLPGGGEPEYPVPVLALSGNGQADPEPTPTTQASPADAAPRQVAQGPASADDTARWLAGGALVLAAAAVVTALVRRNRT